MNHDPNEPRRVLIEQTSKKLKKQAMNCAAIFLFGFVPLFFGWWQLAILIMAGGLIGCVITKQQAWWEHG